MRRPAAVLTAAVTLGACGSPRRMTDVERLHIRDEVHAAVEGRFTAMNDHAADAVAAFYLGEDDFAYAGVSDLIVGGERFRAMTAPWYSLHGDETFEYRIVHTQVLSPTVATVTIRGSTAASAHLLWTNVLVRRDGRWLVALEHESWPGAPEPSAHPMTEE